MKNIWKLLIVAVIVSTTAVGCTDERDNFMVDDTVSFLTADVYQSVSVYNERFEFPVLKNGKGRSGATARLIPSQSTLEAYNEANGTHLELMPSNCYKISPEKIGFGEKDIRKFVEITWDNDAIFALGDNKEYAIALELAVDNDALVVDPNRNVLIVNPTRTSVGMDASLMEPIIPKASGEVVTKAGTISLSDPVSVMDITVNYTIDNSLVASYNTANGTAYKTAPEGLVSLAAQSSVIAAGKKSTDFALNLNSAKLFTDNELKSADEYLVPVKITTLSADGITITNEVTYVPIGMTTVKGPWTLLEGENNCYGKDPDAPNWALGYTADKLFDGEMPAGHEWISSWGHPITFPMVFVVDMGEAHVFTKFIVSDYCTHQGQYRDYNFYTAEEYNGDATKWNLVASGTRDYNWVNCGQPAVWLPELIYDFPVQKMIKGRYLKFEILKPSMPMSGDYLNGRGKLADVQGMGF